jgi:cytochrome oxidase assembly protein ShyY1
VRRCGRIVGVQRYRFAMTPRWILGHILVLLAVVVMVNLGLWQLRRLDERRTYNARVNDRSRLAPVDLTELTGATASGRPASDVEFRRATASGTFDAAHELLVGYRTSQGLPGFHVITPFVLTDGQAVLVNRGFVPLEYANRWPVEEAAPPRGELTIIGLVRQSGHAKVVPNSKPPRFRDVDIANMARFVPAPLVGVQLELQDPVPQGFPDPLPPLDLGEGPHLSYAIQWFGFSTVAVIGWGVLLRRRSGHRRHRPSEPFSQATT